MFSLNEGNRFVVCLQSVDLRKGLDGLCGLIRYLSLSPTNGDVYAFLNKSRTILKLLRRERGGYIIYYKRLESGCIIHKIFIKAGVRFRSFRRDKLVLLMEGISPKIKRRRCYNLQ